MCSAHFFVQGNENVQRVPGKSTVPQVLAIVLPCENRVPMIGGGAPPKDTGIAQDHWPQLPEVLGLEGN